MTIILLVAVIVSAVVLLYLQQRSKKITRLSRYFPSPPSDPFIGHLRALPQVNPWLTYEKWKSIYGDIIYMKVASKSILVLNNVDDAHELFEKRGRNYSDRPRSILLGEMGGLKYFTAILRYGADFRTARRYISQYFNSREHVHLYPSYTRQLEQLLKNLLDSPEKFLGHIIRLTSSTSIKSTYGHNVVSDDDELVKLSVAAPNAVVSLGATGTNSYDLFPVLRHLPRWFPGFRLIGRAKAAKALIDRMVDEPFESVKALRRAGIDRGSFIDSILGKEKQSKNGVIDEKHELILKNTAAQIFGASVVTTGDALNTFVLMMTRHPNEARKAQTEIDRVLGNGRLPTLEDRPNLPYVNCVLKEVWRINPPLPLGAVHEPLHADVYKEKTIPAHTLVISNIWAMMHDERYYPHPYTFNPDRFLTDYTSGVPANDKVHPLNTFKPNDPASLVFGFGRRICPGRYFADATVWLTIANILAVFDILPPVDPLTGKEYFPELEWIGGQTAQMKPFEARIVPRSEKHALLIRKLEVRREEFQAGGTPIVSSS